MQGNCSDVLVKLSAVYSKLRGDVAAQRNDDAAQVTLRLPSRPGTL